MTGIPRSVLSFGVGRWWCCTFAVRQWRAQGMTPASMNRCVQEEPCSCRQLTARAELLFSHPFDTSALCPKDRILRSAAPPCPCSSPGRTSAVLPSEAVRAEHPILGIALPGLRLLHAGGPHPEWSCAGGLLGEDELSACIRGGFKI